MNGSDVSKQLPVALLFLRIGVAALMIPWAIDKLVRPEHAAAIFQHFYFLSELPSTAFYALGAAQLILILAFLCGFAKAWTCGAVLAMHTVSTLSSWKQYLAPFEGTNLLFFAAWPALAACVALFLLRHNDRLLSFR